MNALLRTALIGFIVVTFSGFFGGWNFFLDLTSHFHLQYYLITSALMIYFVIRRDWRWAALAVIPVAVNGLLIFSWFIAPAPVQEKPNFRLFLSNVEKDNKNYPAVIKQVLASNADVAVLVETSLDWAKQFECLKQKYPYQLIRGRLDCFGMSIFSRFPIEAQSPVPHEDGEVYSHMMKITRDGKSFTLIAVHVQPPSSFWRFARRTVGYKELICQVQVHPAPLIVAGDFNTGLWSPYYRKLIRQTRLANVRQGFGVLQTWPTFAPDWMRIPLDQCLVSPDIQVIKVTTGRKNGSDHLPMTVDFKI
ncbi:MAG: endonuclease/exonuclease/phosphatase family protein [Candidatus Omnitrophica bacterium]|nr:endonuclease/exonuclease/phosphatase family protein [Candidatus Omnitrophota bacterium]